MEGIKLNLPTDYFSCEPLPDEHEGHRERIRSRILSRGLDSLKPIEVLEFLIYSVLPRQDVTELAEALLEKFETLAGVLDAPEDELLSVEGMSGNIIEWFRLVQQGVKLYSNMNLTELPDMFILQDVLSYCENLGAARTGKCIQLCISSEMKLLARSAMVSMTGWARPYSIMNMMEDILNHSCHSVLLVLFPEKLPARPRAYDMQHIREYTFALNAVGICLLDFIYLAKDGICSLRRMGLLKEETPAAAKLMEINGKYMDSLEEYFRAKTEEETI